MFVVVCCGCVCVERERERERERGRERWRERERERKSETKNLNVEAEYSDVLRFEEMRFILAPEYPKQFKSEKSHKKRGGAD